MPPAGRSCSWSPTPPRWVTADTQLKNHLTGLGTHTRAGDDNSTRRCCSPGCRQRRRLGLRLVDASPSHQAVDATCRSSWAKARTMANMGMTHRQAPSTARPPAAPSHHDANHPLSAGLRRPDRGRPTSPSAGRARRRSRHCRHLAGDSRRASSTVSTRPHGERHAPAARRVVSSRRGRRAQFSARLGPGPTPLGGPPAATSHADRRSAEQPSSRPRCRAAHHVPVPTRRRAAGVTWPDRRPHVRSHDGQ